MSCQINILKIYCNCCGKIFYMCRRCYRGHCYCSLECRISGYLQSHRDAQAKYRKTPKGKEQHRSAEERRRDRKENNNKWIQLFKQSCMCLSMVLKSLYKSDQIEEKEHIGYCDKCGQQGIIVDEFPPRGYGSSEKQNNKQQYSERQRAG